MSKEIKTRTVIKDIKVLDKAASGTAHAKSAFIRSKESAEAAQDTRDLSPSEYAADNLTDKTKDVTQEAANRLRNPHKKAVENVNKAKERFQEAKRNLPRQRKQAAEQAKKAADNAKQTADALKGKAEQTRKTAEQAKKAVTDVKRTLQQTRQAGRQTVQTAKQTGKGVKATGKGTVKTVKKSVKTAERTAKVAVKTAKQTAKATQQSAKAAAKAAKLAAQASKAAAKAAVATAKAAVKATIAFVKATIAAVKGLIALIAAGGWVAVLIIVIICLIGLLVGSVFGVFFSGEDSGTGRTMPAVVSELTSEFYNKIEDIKSRNTHDVLDVDAMAINWPEVLAVYAVKVHSDPDNPAEIATLDDGKIEKLRGVLNDMVSLSHSLKTETQQRTVTTTDEDGNETETTEAVSVTTLKITLSCKSADDMAAEYSFSTAQKEQLHELLSPEYSDMWAALLGGYSAGNGELFAGNTNRIPKGIFSWPVVVDHPITSGYGYRKDPIDGTTKYHGGIDIGAPTGTLILATADGTVIAANSADSWGGGYGYYVKIQHADGYATLYAHCSQIAVTGGQEVKKGQVIGYVGSTGKSTGPHLHFEAWKDETRTNPLNYFE